MTNTSKKKQHYVPRFYLKYFSNNRKSIHLWNIRRQLYAANASIKEQAYAENFYGQDGKIEDALASIESDASRVLSKIIAKMKIPKHHTKDRLLLYVFVMFQAERTKASAEDYESLMDQVMKAAYGKHPNAKDIVPYVDFKVADPAVEKLRFASQFVPLILDLNAKLGINLTEHEFITSDNPVVRYNQFFEIRRWPGSTAGWANPGLQILFPLSPRLLLILYDNGMYKIGRFYQQKVYVPSTSDVNRINGLQFIRADENLYFSNNVSQFHIARMHRRWAKYRKRRVSVQEYEESNPIPNSARRSSLLVSSMNDLRTGMQLSFIRFRADPFKKKLGPTMWNPRNKYVERILIPFYANRLSPRKNERSANHST